ncbi:MAG: sigma-70 family RNA polymerase sigma factor [Patescibacteria group bacterium]
MDPEKNKILELVAHAQAGDEFSMGELFERYHQAIYRFHAYRVGSAEDAEDLTQTTFLEMVRSLPQYHPRAGISFSSWLFSIARYRLIDYYRRHANNIPFDKVSPDEYTRMQSDTTNPDYDSRIPMIRRQMRQLPENYQTILQLTLLEGLNLREAAHAMKISSLHARVLKHRAIKKLKSLMPEYSFNYEQTDQP